MKNITIFRLVALILFGQNCCMLLCDQSVHKLVSSNRGHKPNPAGGRAVAVKRLVPTHVAGGAGHVPVGRQIVPAHHGTSEIGQGVTIDDSGRKGTRREVTHTPIASPTERIIPGESTGVSKTIQAGKGRAPVAGEKGYFSPAEIAKLRAEPQKFVEQGGHVNAGEFVLPPGKVEGQWYVGTMPGGVLEGAAPAGSPGAAIGGQLGPAMSE